MKKYSVCLMNWYGGETKHFWFKKNALNFIKPIKKNWLWIDLTNNWTRKKKRLKNTDTSLYYRTERGEYIKKEL